MAAARLRWLAALGVALLVGRLLGPGGQEVAQAAPVATTSRYMATVDGPTLYNEGCSQGRAAENGLAILDFGQPWIQNGAYGTILFDGFGTFATTAQIEAAVEQFLSGYWNCSPGTTFLRLGIGTSNFHGETSGGHGQAWAGLVTAVSTWIDTPPSFAAQEAARGANDFEMGWNTAAASRAWADGFSAATSLPYYDYGDCEGCPTGGGVLGVPGALVNNGWTQEDVWYVAYGAPSAYPVPEIYLTSGTNAAQWQQLSLYAYVNHAGAMHFLAALTQSQACLSGGGCFGADNTPDQGWSQLSNALNADARTAQVLDWVSDVTWAN